MRIWKAKIGFTLKKKDYNDIISRLKSANTFLHDLVKDSRVLGASRKRRSHNQILRLLRTLARSLFDALRDVVIGCYCPHPYKACLELVVRDLAFIRYLDTEDELAKEVPFHVVLSSVVSENTLVEFEELPPPNIRWTSFRLQCRDFNSFFLQSTEATSPPISNSSGISFRTPEEESEKDSMGILASLPPVTKWKSLFKGSSLRYRKVVTFESGSATQTLVQLSTTTTTNIHLLSPQSYRRASTPESRLNLCRISLGKRKKLLTSNKD